eukprot:5746338-Pyramimonas_sp.AAC.1
MGLPTNLPYTMTTAMFYPAYTSSGIGGVLQQGIRVQMRQSMGQLSTRPRSEPSGGGEHI